MDWGVEKEHGWGEGLGGEERGETLTGMYNKKTNRKTMYVHEEK